MSSSSLRSSLMQCPRYLYLVTLVNNTLFNSKFGMRIYFILLQRKIITLLSIHGVKRIAASLLVKAKMYAISSDTHQLLLINLHHFKLELGCARRVCRFLCSSTMARDGGIMQIQHLCHYGDTICHPMSGYETTQCLLRMQQ